MGGVALSLLYSVNCWARGVRWNGCIVVLAVLIAVRGDCVVLTMLIVARMGGDML